MTTLHAELKLPNEKIDLLNELARARHLEMDDMLALAIIEWLEQEAKRQHGWQTLREFAGSYSSSETNNSIARDHDKYLYGKL